MFNYHAVAKIGICAEKKPVVEANGPNSMYPGSVASFGYFRVNISPVIILLSLSFVTIYFELSPEFFGSRPHNPSDFKFVRAVEVVTELTVTEVVPSKNCQACNEQ